MEPQPSVDTVKLRVELPSYSYSFTVDAPLHGSIADVKRLVYSRCTGNPSAEGQRIIWRGRALGDAEKVEDLWKSPDSSRIVLLAVHPSAWTTSPPVIPAQPSTPSAPSNTANLMPTPTQPQAQISYQTSQFPTSIHSLSQHRPISSSNPTSATLNPTFTPLQPTPTVAENPASRSEGQEYNTIPYIVFQHKNALITLVGGRRTQLTSEIAQSQTRSKDTLAQWGYLWPAILDEEYPAVNEKQGEGALYGIVELDGRSYLKLHSPHLKPSPAHIHALKVLTYTFPILSHAQQLANQARTSNAQQATQVNQARIPLNPDQIHLPPNINELLQQLGLPRLQLQPGQRVAVNHVNVNVQNGAGVGAAIAELPIRRLVIPLTMLMLRTILLLYFIAPIRKPVFAALVIMWVTYEGWQAIRQWIGQLARPQGRGQQQPRAPGVVPEVNNVQVNQQQGAQGNAGVNQPQAGVNFQPAAPPAIAPRVPLTLEQQITVVFNALSTVNIQTEDYFLSAAADERAVVQRIAPLTKITTFFILFFMTLHPAAWNKRRAALRSREGRIRTEAAIRRSEEREVGGDEGENNGEIRAHSLENRAFNENRRKLIAVHARRPKWMKDYIDRVVAGDWVDDAD